METNSTPILLTLDNTLLLIHQQADVLVLQTIQITVYPAPTASIDPVATFMYWMTLR